MTKQEFSFDFCGNTIKVEHGEIAKQAGGSVLIRYRDTVVLSTATASKQAKDIDFPINSKLRRKIIFCW